MIKINYCFTTAKNSKATRIYSIKITGHSVDEKLCAGVSAVSFGILNAIVDMKLEKYVIINCSPKYSKNDIEVKVIKVNDKLNVILETYKVQLNTLKYNNKKEIQVKESLCTNII